MAEIKKQNGKVQNGHVHRGPKLKIAIAGGGPVGALSACFFARRGHDVHLYEYREDIREMKHVPGRSINMTLAVRGCEALRKMGLEDEVKGQGIPMYARMIHSIKGSTSTMPYGSSEQCIYSIGRRFLNEILLSAAEKYPNVHMHFHHKLIGADLHGGAMTFEKQTNKEIVTHTANLIVGADGAYSSMRKQLMKQPLFNFNQTYIEHGYLELYMPPNFKGEPAMPKNFMHIWPRRKFMMIAQPNPDSSWTMTLFMPFPVFDKITTPDLLIDFFRKNFCDAVPLIGEERLVKDFFAKKPSPLVSVKCSPYNIGKSLIIGDAAHAMVPFYGQGMNAGFEDCTLLDEMMSKHDFDLGTALKEFSILRNPDAEAICKLAMYNYIEMRVLLNKRSFLLRKKLDRMLHWIAPNFWVPLYASVTFSNMRYSDCLRNKQWQDKVINRSLILGGAVTVAGVTYSIMRWQNNIENAVTFAVNKIKSLYM